MRKIERTVAPSVSTRVAVRKEFVPIPLNREQKQNLKIYGTLNKPETKQTELSQGRKLSPGEQVVRDKKLAKQSDLEEYQKRKEKEAKDLEQALVVAPYVIPGIGQVMWAGKAVDLAVSGASDGKYKSWGNMVDQKTGSGKFIGELTNPGYYAGAFPKLLSKGIQSTSKYALQKAEPYLLGGKSIPMMSGYKPVLNFVDDGAKNNLTSHLQGGDAVKMFREYGGQPIPKGSPLGERITRYIPEVKERYGLTSSDISDKDISEALYKHLTELQKQTKSANVNSLGEPRLLFRGDTQRYETLLERPSPEKLAGMSGTMDNSLGNLFLGDLPHPNKGRGIDRYITTQMTGRFNKINPSGTGSKITIPSESIVKETTPLVDFKTKFGDYTVSKVHPKYNESGINDINAYFVNTKNIREATDEISVLNDDILAKYGNFKGDRQVIDRFDGPTADAVNSETREQMGKHYSEVLKDAYKNKQGLLKSKAADPNKKGIQNLRDEHEFYDYFAVPNWNKNNVKHILPYDLRIPRDWSNPNIYKAVVPAAVLYRLPQSKKQDETD